MSEESELTAFAKIAYHAYGKVTDFKNFQGNPMPLWVELPKKIQQAWKAAVQAVCKESRQFVIPHTADMAKAKESFDRQFAVIKNMEAEVTKATLDINTLENDLLSSAITSTDSLT